MRRTLLVLGVLAVSAWGAAAMNWAQDAGPSAVRSPSLSERLKQIRQQWSPANAEGARIAAKEDRDAPPSTRDTVAPSAPSAGGAPAGPAVGSSVLVPRRVPTAVAPSQDMAPSPATALPSIHETSPAARRFAGTGAPPVRMADRPRTPEDLPQTKTTATGDLSPHTSSRRVVPRETKPVPNSTPAALSQGADAAVPPPNASIGTRTSAPSAASPVASPSPTQSPAADLSPSRPLADPFPPRTAARETPPALPPAARISAPPSAGGPKPPPVEILLAGKGAMIHVEAAGPKALIVGKAAPYTVTVENVGPINAADVVLSIGMPAWAEVADVRATSGTAAVSVGETSAEGLKWRMSELAAGRREELTLEIVPRENRPIDLRFHWHVAPAAAEAHIEVLQPRLAVEIGGPDELAYGARQTYKVTLTNSGTGDAEGVVVRLAPVAEGMPEEAMTRIGRIPAGGRKTLDLELTPHEAGTVDVAIEAIGDAGLRAEAFRKVLVRRARLEVAVDGPPMKYAGTEAAYHVRVTNAGNDVAEGVEVTAMLPPGARPLAASDGGKHAPDAAAVAWQLGSLHPGATRVLDVRCRLDTMGVHRLEARATAAGNLAASHASTTQVEALADLKLGVNDPSGPMPVGEDAVYELRIVNRGTKAASDIKAAVYFSDGVAPLAVEGGRAEIGRANVVFAPIGRIEPGEELVLKVTARASLPGSHVFRAEIECRDPETRLVAQETTRFYGTLDLRARLPGGMLR
jgi:uncharacterized repeat protein (TIGR01451 family)